MDTSGPTLSPTARPLAAATPNPAVSAPATAADEAPATSGFGTALSSEQRYDAWLGVTKPPDPKVSGAAPMSAPASAPAGAKEKDEHEAEHSSEKKEAEHASDRIHQGAPSTQDRQQVRQQDVKIQAAHQAAALEHEIAALAEDVDSMHGDVARLRTRTPSPEIDRQIAGLEADITDREAEMERRRTELMRCRNRAQFGTQDGARDLVDGQYERAAADAAARKQDLQRRLQDTAGRIDVDLAYLGSGDKAAAPKDLDASGGDLQAQRDLADLQRVIDFKTRREPT